MRFAFLTIFLCSITFSFSQEMLPLSLRQKAESKMDSWVKETPFEKVDIANIGNKISAFSIKDDNILEMILAPESGGLWYSRNGGESFQFLFENQPTNQVTALAVNWKENTIWVGTPYGLFFSPDLGKNWHFGGLSSVKNITSIAINPKNKDEITVGVFGDAYNADEKRGIFKTSDNGKTWQHKLFVNTRTGINQIVATESENVLYAAAWQTNNSYWSSAPYGKSSGIYKSEDGGENWNHITSSGGFPNGDFIGKIGLSVYDKNTIFAVVDNRSVKSRPSPPRNNTVKISSIYLNDRDFDTMSKADFLQLDDHKLNAFLHVCGQSEKYTSQNLKNMVFADITSPARILTFLGIRQREVLGAEVYATDDGGKTWKKTHNQPLNDVFYQSGELFGGITVNPENKEHLFIGGFPLLESIDGGKTWKSINTVSLKKGYNTVYYRNNTIFATTNDGLSISYDNGKKWLIKNVPQLSSFKKFVYSKKLNTLFLVGEQGVWKKKNHSWSKISSFSHFFSGNNLYVGEQNGTFYEFDPDTNTYQSLGSLYFGENKNPIRFGKETPLLISPQNNDILYVGSNKLHISMDRGKNWRAISEDLTNGDKKENKASGTISAIAESPFLFGLIYVGTDDGMIHTSNNGGVSWQMIHNAFPQPLKVTNLIASRHDRSRVITSLSSVDENDQTPFIFISPDFGKTWTDIRSNLPEGKINSIKEDPKNEQILYAGTDSGVFVSFNLGEKWHLFQKNLPETGVLDLFVDENTGELWISTAGNGVYKTSIEIMQQLRVSIISQDFFPLQEKIRIPHSSLWGNTWSEWVPTESPQVFFDLFASKEGLPVTVRIMRGKITLQTLIHKTNEGFNYIPYDLSFSDTGKLMYEKSAQRLFLVAAPNGKVYLPKGKYTVVFNVENGFEEERELEIY